MDWVFELKKSRKLSIDLTSNKLFYLKSNNT